MTLRPTIRAALLVAMGFPIALLPTLVSESLWWAVLVFDLALLVAFVGDALWAPRDAELEIALETPKTLSLGESAECRLTVDAARMVRGVTFDALLQLDGPHPPIPLTRLISEASGTHSASFDLRPERRGRVEVRHLWLRWSGPLGLVSRARHLEPRDGTSVVPNIHAVQRAALRLHEHKTFISGLKTRRFVGDGSEFDSLRQYVPGLDHRQIDWKATSRHRRLLTRENRAERNHRIVLAYDTGRLMAEPSDGIPKLDHAVNAGLLLAYLSLKMGDQVGACAFDSQLRGFVAPQPGIGSLHRIMKLAADLEYTNYETNFTLGLVELSKRLRRRSVVVVLTDFTDTIGAELLVENLHLLAKRHLVLFVSLRDPEMRRLVDEQPTDILDVHRAMIAHDLEKERARVIQELQRRGIFCVDAPPSEIGAELINQYLEVQRRELV